jgi:acyl-CoA dehydrogenase
MKSITNTCIGFTRTGQGELVEKIYREIPGARIPGGSEDVLLDLSVRQLVKNYKAKTKALQAAGVGYTAKL